LRALGVVRDGVDEESFRGSFVVSEGLGGRRGGRVVRDGLGSCDGHGGLSELGCEESSTERQGGLVRERRRRW
jgi:hypothetical protein